MASLLKQVRSSLSLYPRINTMDNKRNNMQTQRKKASVRAKTNVSHGKKGIGDVELINSIDIIPFRPSKYAMSPI